VPPAPRRAAENWGEPALVLTPRALRCILKRAGSERTAVKDLSR